MVWKSVRKGTNVNETLLLPEEKRGRTGKRLANRWNRKRFTKKAYAGRGQETKWEIPVKIKGEYFSIRNTLRKDERAQK